MKPLLLRNALFVLLLLGAAVIVPACSRNDAAPQAVQGTAKSAPAASALSAAAPHWYFFHTGSDGSIRLQGTETIGEVPQIAFRPWTEAVRVAGSSLSTGHLFLINKCGLYPPEMLQPDAPLRVQHPQLASTTAADIYAVGGETYLRIYQDSAFLPPEQLTNTSFLLQYNAASASCTPVADAGLLQLPGQAQCKSLMQAQGQWYASFKADNGTDISFVYVRCKDFSMFMQPEAYQHSEQITAEELRAACEPQPYTQLPASAKALTDTLTTAADMYILLSSDSGVQEDIFFKPAQGTKAQPASAQQPLNAHAVVYTGAQNRQYAALLLPDGTFIMGAEHQKPQTLHLPALPENFSYTSFLITETEITAAWEESVFYSVGRTGFFAAALEDLSR